MKLLEVSMILNSITKENYIVGGHVRDTLLGLSPKDIDLVTDAPYAKMSAAFKEAGWQTKEIGKKYLVLNISKEGVHYEISNFRWDSDNNGGIIGNISTDANRRDFTVNALYLPIGLECIMDNVIDPTGKGKEDIRNRCIRFIGKASNRIIEDPLRIARFYRLMHTKGLEPHKQSLRAVRQNFDYAFKNTSAERWRNEIERMIGLT